MEILAQIREYFKVCSGILSKNIHSKIKAYTPKSSNKHRLLMIMKTEGAYILEN